MVLWSYKIPKTPHAVVCSKEEGLYYARLTGTTLLACGKTLQEALEELMNILHEFNDMVDRSDVASMLRKDSFGEKLEYIVGLLPGFLLFHVVAPILRRGRFNGRDGIKRNLNNINDIGRTLKLLHA